MKATPVIEVIVSVQPELGQSGAPGTTCGAVGATVVTENEDLPKWMLAPGMVDEPVAVPLVVTGLRPVGWVPFPGLEQEPVPEIFAGALRLTVTSPFPSPAISPAAVNVLPLSVYVVAGFLVKWTLPAEATPTRASTVTTAATATIILNILRPPLCICNDSDSETG